MPDLIDTLWNVKFVAALSVCFPLFRFNRYIVECKVEKYARGINSGKRFNRYIVECKAAAMTSVATTHIDLIDTLWNVKLKDKFI